MRDDRSCSRPALDGLALFHGVRKGCHSLYSSPETGIITYGGLFPVIRPSPVYEALQATEAEEPPAIVSTILIGTGRGRSHHGTRHDLYGLIPGYERSSCTTSSGLMQIAFAISAMSSGSSPSCVRMMRRLPRPANQPPSR
jgi:hypothetical protein